MTTTDRTAGAPTGSPIRDVETPLTEAEIVEFGLEQAPADAGPSLEEIEQRRRMRHG